MTRRRNQSVEEKLKVDLEILITGFWLWSVKSPSTGLESCGDGGEEELLVLAAFLEFCTASRDGTFLIMLESKFPDFKVIFSPSPFLLSKPLHSSKCEFLQPEAKRHVAKQWVLLPPVTSSIHPTSLRLDFLPNGKAHPRFHWHFLSLQTSSFIDSPRKAPNLTRTLQARIT
jgi:hypothetical protein